MLFKNVKFPEEMVGDLLYEDGAHELFWVAFQQNTGNTIIYASRYIKKLFLHARPGRTKNQNNNVYKMADFKKTYRVVPCIVHPIA